MLILVGRGETKNPVEKPLRNVDKLQQAHWVPGRWLEMTFLVTFIAYVNILPLTILS